MGDVTSCRAIFRQTQSTIASSLYPPVIIIINHQFSQSHTKTSTHIYLQHTVHVWKKHCERYAREKALPSTTYTQNCRFISLLLLSGSTALEHHLYLGGKKAHPLWTTGSKADNPSHNLIMDWNRAHLIPSDDRACNRISFHHSRLPWIILDPHCYL